jgi:hypothetical protein
MGVATTVVKSRGGKAETSEWRVLQTCATRQELWLLTPQDFLWKLGVLASASIMSMQLDQIPARLAGAE